MNQSDYNPFMSSGPQHNISVNANNFNNPFTTQASPAPASRFIYTEKKDMNDPLRVASTDNINIQMSNNVFDDDFQIKTHTINDDVIISSN